MIDSNVEGFVIKYQWRFFPIKDQDNLSLSYTSFEITTSFHISDCLNCEKYYDFERFSFPKNKAPFLIRNLYHFYFLLSRIMHCESTLLFATAIYRYIVSNVLRFTSNLIYLAGTLDYYRSFSKLGVSITSHKEFQSRYNWNCQQILL